MKRRRKRRTGLLPAVLAVAIVAAAAIFFAVFYVPDENIEVVGNTRYKESEIRQIALPGFIHRNTLFLRLFRKTINPDQVPFINSINVEYVASDRVRLHVNEDYPIGYILQDGYRFYFDSVGLVTECLEDEAGTTETKKDTEEIESTTVSTAETDSTAETESTIITESEAETKSAVETENAAETESADKTESAAESESTKGSEDLTETQDSETENKLQSEPISTADTTFRPAVTDVSPVIGLTQERVGVGDMIQVDDPEIFQTLLTINRMISKFGIQADSIQVGKTQDISLFYGNAEIRLGTDELLEEKMTRATAILPQIRGMKGILHLENYSEDTINIIFEQLK